MLQALHIEAHAAGSSSDGTDGSVHIGSGQIRLFGLNDFFELITSDRTDFLGVRDDQNRS